MRAPPSSVFIAVRIFAAPRARGCSSAWRVLGGLWSGKRYE